jgi:hypothetical protein
MSKAEIKKFVQETVKEIRDGLPEGFRIDDKIHFDISVVTTSKAKGGLDIKIASIGSDLESKNVHRINFSIVDEKAQAKAWKIGESILTKFFTNLAKLDTENDNQITYKAKPIRRKTSRERKE